MESMLEETNMSQKLIFLKLFPEVDVFGSILGTLEKLERIHATILNGGGCEKP